MILAQKMEKITCAISGSLLGRSGIVETSGTLQTAAKGLFVLCVDVRIVKKAPERLSFQGTPGISSRPGRKAACDRAMQISNRRL